MEVIDPLKKFLEKEGYEYVYDSLYQNGIRTVKALSKYLPGELKDIVRPFVVALKLVSLAKEECESKERRTELVLHEDRGKQVESYNREKQVESYNLKILELQREQEKRKREEERQRNDMEINRIIQEEARKRKQDLKFYQQELAHREKQFELEKKVIALENSSPAYVPPSYPNLNQISYPSYVPPTYPNLNQISYPSYVPPSNFPSALGKRWNLSMSSLYPNNPIANTYDSLVDGSTLTGASTLFGPDQWIMADFCETVVVSSVVIGSINSVWADYTTGLKLQFSLDNLSWHTIPEIVISSIPLCKTHSLNHVVCRSIRLFREYGYCAAGVFIIQ